MQKPSECVSSGLRTSCSFVASSEPRTEPAPCNTWRVRSDPAEPTAADLSPERSHQTRVSIMDCTRAPEHGGGGGVTALGAAGLDLTVVPLLQDVRGGDVHDLLQNKRERLLRCHRHDAGAGLRRRCHRRCARHCPLLSSVRAPVGGCGGGGDPKERYRELLPPAPGSLALSLRCSRPGPVCETRRCSGANTTRLSSPRIDAHTARSCCIFMSRTPRPLAG